jgi:flavin reductase (DIM6/NTAB) family NADH-FMN oxidoreductase RutF
MERPTSGIDLDFAELAPRLRYKLLCGLIVPRPIAWVTTVSTAGMVNAAPFSFFNVFSEDPALIVLGLQHKADGAPKDTTRNIRDGGEFVVNVVDEPLAGAMNFTAIDFPEDVSEPELAGLGLAASARVKPPRLASAPAAFECRRTLTLAFGPRRELLIGEVLGVHARAGTVDPETLRVDLDALRPVGRLFGNAYARQRDTFELERLTHAEWLAGQKRD